METAIKQKRFDTIQFAIDVYTYRVENKLTRNELWLLVGFGSNDSISRIEVEKRRPTIEVAFNLCELMERNLNDYMK